MKNKLIGCVVFILIMASCKNGNYPAAGGNLGTQADSALGFVVADTIIYDVTIQNPNPDDAWTTQCLRGLDHRLLVDSIFGMLYAGKAKAYDHLTREELTPNRIRKIETSEGFSRNDISMIQFTEVWYMNPRETAITKKVLAMVLGYNYYNPEGERFHKALFRVEM